MENLYNKLTTAPAWDKYQRFYKPSHQYWRDSQPYDVFEDGSILATYYATKIDHRGWFNDMVGVFRTTDKDMPKLSLEKGGEPIPNSWLKTGGTSSQLVFLDKDTGTAVGIRNWWGNSGLPLPENLKSARAYKFAEGVKPVGKQITVEHPADKLLTSEEIEFKRDIYNACRVWWMANKTDELWKLKTKNEQGTVTVFTYFGMTQMMENNLGIESLSEATRHDIAMGKFNGVTHPRKGMVKSIKHDYLYIAE